MEAEGTLSLERFCRALRQLVEARALRGGASLAMGEAFLHEGARLVVACLKRADALLGREEEGTYAVARLARSVLVGEEEAGMRNALALTTAMYDGRGDLVVEVEEEEEDATLLYLWVFVQGLLTVVERRSGERPREALERLVEGILTEVG